MTQRGLSFKSILSVRKLWHAYLNKTVKYLLPQNGKYTMYEVPPSRWAMLSLRLQFNAHEINMSLLRFSLESGGLLLSRWDPNLLIVDMLWLYVSGGSTSEFPETIF